MQMIKFRSISTYKPMLGVFTWKIRVIDSFLLTVQISCRVNVIYACVCEHIPILTEKELW